MTRSPLPAPTIRDLAQQLRDAIHAGGISQNELAQRADVDQAVISRFLSGKRDLHLATAARIAGVLNVRLVEVGRVVKRGRPAKVQAPEPAPSPDHE